MERHAGQPEVVDRYAIFDKIGAGGMASVYLGRLVGPVGFSRTVAIKRLHPGFAEDPEIVAMLIDEARVAGRIRHPNVVPTLDVVASGGEVLLVMEYVQGESLAKLVIAARARGERVPLPIASAILSGMLHGLHAAHEATAADGTRLGLVHRDVSPQNVIVGVDGVARVIDFGVAKAMGRLQTTREGQVKGKLAYMAPEQWAAKDVSPATDLYAAGIVAWELLTLSRLHGDSKTSIRGPIAGGVPPPSGHAPEVTPELDAIVLRATRTAPEERFADAREMALAIERAVPPATATTVGAWVARSAAEALRVRSERVAELEGATLATELVAAGDAGALPRPRPRRRALAGGALVLALVAAAVAVGLVLRFGRGSSAAPAVVDPGASRVVAAASATPANATATATATATTSASASASAGASSASSATPAAATSARGSRHGRTAPRSKPDCDPPYVLDRNGQRQYKAACL